MRQSGHIGASALMLNVQKYEKSAFYANLGSRLDIFRLKIGEISEFICNFAVLTTS